MKSEYEVVMGLEVHVELATNSKLFCGCSAKFGAGPNEHVCPACAGMPGLPPVANKRAIELGMVAALVTNSEISRTITFDKKNYFYPDLPTGYQITQWFAPICRSGYVDIETPAGQKRIRLKQIHIEEDAGKLVHDFRTDTSLVDYNRAGVPLVEIVSTPDFRTADEVIAFLSKLRSTLTFAGVSDCKMQEGSMRCDVNISVRPAGSQTLGTRTEMKNMNSLKAIVRAIAYESQRHIDALDTGCEELVQETRRWDDARNESFSMRGKEDATDYRYFPNPEVMPIVIDDGWLQSMRESLPELADATYKRFTEEYGLSEYDSKLLTSSRHIADIFDATLKYCHKPHEIAKWMLVELFGIAKGDAEAEDEIAIDCEKFAGVIQLVDSRTISRAVGKKILALVYKEGIDPKAYVTEHKLEIVEDTGFLEQVAREVIAENEKPVQQYLQGNEKVQGFLMGQMMRKTQGKADPAAARDVLFRLLDEMGN